ncbi:hypothetical protein B0H16DRAFT_1734163 [Mycena metata]|uniref:Uncharacterized protein n=1 Tax=Mycena metata TaxID=1033252 RepID=A0AAD7HXY6_9AGAR|nr:hypothetical protein B0H16DRAFT_1734163 [Mycena metata]
MFGNETTTDYNSYRERLGIEQSSPAYLHRAPLNSLRVIIQVSRKHSHKFAASRELHESNSLAEITLNNQRNVTINHAIFLGNAVISASEFDSWSSRLAANLWECFRETWNLNVHVHPLSSPTLALPHPSRRSTLVTVVVRPGVALVFHNLFFTHLALEHRLSSPRSLRSCQEQVKSAKPRQDSAHPTCIPSLPLYPTQKANQAKEQDQKSSAASFTTKEQERACLPDSPQLQEFMELSPTPSSQSSSDSSMDSDISDWDDSDTTSNGWSDILGSDWRGSGDSSQSSDDSTSFESVSDSGDADDEMPALLPLGYPDSDDEDNSESSSTESSTKSLLSAAGQDGGAIRLGYSSHRCRS